MIIGIDASNIRVGGGVHHLVEVLAVAKPDKHAFSKIVLFGGSKTLDQIEPRPWLIKVIPPALNGSLMQRVGWQRFMLSGEARRHGCDLLFVPGGSFAGDFTPVVSMSQNLLPFQWKELCRYGWSLVTVKMMLLRLAQARTFASVEGVIFLTEHAREAVLRVVQIPVPNTTIVPHGINVRFFSAPKPQLPISNYSSDRPYRILYISTIDVFKHQWNVVEGIAKLRSLGYPVILDLIGSSYAPAFYRLKQALVKHDPEQTFARYIGPLPYNEIEKKYSEADLFVFASSCETFGQIITEAMCAGLPIACSERSAMSELLGNCGIYFDPEDSESIANAIRRLLDDPSLRGSIATGANKLSTHFSWERCADETFKFFRTIHRRAKQ